MATKQFVSKTQRGAALIVGLLLLVVLSLLAIAGINSASLEFIMAGNEQYKQNSFQAAESGIEYAMAHTDQFVASYDSAASTFTANNNAIPGTSDTFSYTVSFKTTGGTPPGYSQGAGSQIAGYYFQIDSTGNAARGATITDTQGVVIVGQTDNSISIPPCTPLPTCQILH